MDDMRRSARIAKEIAILLLATDASGKVYSEQTKTVSLSLHGAGILSRHSFAPEEILTIRTLDPCKEAEIRVIGQVVRGPDGYVYGVAFTDPQLDFWQIGFPAPNGEPESAKIILECRICHDHQILKPNEIESDACHINGSSLRHCEVCGVTTNWKRADPNADPALSPRWMPAPVRSLASQSAYDDSTAADITSHLVAPIPELAAALTALADAPLPQARSHRSTPASNRRHSKRVGVRFTACVRHADSGDDVVECSDVSKGGLRFRSRKHYRVHSLIEVAVPYSPGQTPIFLPASIRHVEKLPGDDFYCYGAAYAKAH